MNTCDYSILTKLLHKIVFRSKSISEISFEIEKAIYLSGDASKITNDKHVFVSGLARSGTTILMSCLYETNYFASLTYADMPFVLAPNLWHKLSIGKSNYKYQERAHKDGIFINSNSPEAFDEVFWKIFLNNDYILQDRLVVNKIPANIIALYCNYIHLVLKSNFKVQKIRYLSKNNNNILRFSSILDNFPKSYIIIPFRDPLQHSLSLMNQHQHFCEIHKNDSFTLDYMNWIGHYEFGLNQKPFFLNNDTVFKQQAKYNKENINYWLLTWFNYYSYVLDNYSDTCILFSHENFCNEPNNAMDQLFKRIDLPQFNFNLIPFTVNIRTDSNINRKILEDCQVIYNKLCEASPFSCITPKKKSRSTLLLTEEKV
jgi:hypothetical protein